MEKSNSNGIHSAAVTIFVWRHGLVERKQAIRKGTYKGPYPRTLLADVLHLLMECRGLKAKNVSEMVGVGRDALSHVLHAVRHCKRDLLGRILVALLLGCGAQPLIDAFFSDSSAVLLGIPALVAQMEPHLAPQRQDATAAGLDLGALQLGYGLREIIRDTETMESRCRWPVACQWAGFAATTARRARNEKAALQNDLWRARLLLASSRFDESRSVLEAALAHPAVARGGDGHGDEMLVRVQGEIYHGWLNYELGEYRQAAATLTAAVERLLAPGRKAPSAEQNQFVRRPAGTLDIRALDSLSALAPAGDGRMAPAKLLNVALHTRAKALAEEAMYMCVDDEERLGEAARALAESIAVSAYLSQAGLLGHGLLWLGRLGAVWQFNHGATRFVQDGCAMDILRAAEHPAAKLTAPILRNGIGRPYQLVAVANSACFSHTQGSSLRDGYVARAAGIIKMLRGEINKAKGRDDYAAAFRLLTRACRLFSRQMPDLRALGPLLFEMHRLHRWDKRRQGLPDALDWLVASLAAHPTPFAVAALRDWDGAGNVEESCARVLSGEGPFVCLNHAAEACWMDDAQQRLRGNLEKSLAAAEAARRPR